jgi:hypothetical protein
VIPLYADWIFWHPAGLATLAYAREEGRADVSYAHTVRTNLLLGQLVLIDEVALHGAIPVDEDDEVWIASTLGYQRGRLLGSDGEPANRVDVFVGDAGVAWQVADHLTLSARYQHIRQISDADLPPLPLSFDRNTVMATVTLKYPPDRDMPRQYRAPMRVDESDDFTAEEPDAAPIPGVRR